MAVIQVRPNKVSEYSVRRVTNPLNDCSITVKNKSENKMSGGKNLSKNPVVTGLAKRELPKHLHNIRTILLYTNATPIKNCITDLGYSCGFCSKRYLNLADLKEHTLCEHNDEAKRKYMESRKPSEYIVKVDVTSLTCLLCCEKIETLEQAMDHLRDEHEKIVHTDIKNHIIPLKFDDGKFKCVLCSNEYDFFKTILSHMNVHYDNYPCPTCDKAFTNCSALKAHIATHKQGDFGCSYCAKVFDTLAKKSNHEKCVHINGDKRSKCHHCGEMFTNFDKKQDHMVDVHGAEPRVIKCKACELTFKRIGGLRFHIKKYHLMEWKYECEHCEKKFISKKESMNHMLKHTGKKEYQCNFCSKFFGRKYTLTEHLRIHANDRRFKCEHCGQKFIQKCSWKSHMKLKHGEIF